MLKYRLLTACTLIPLVLGCLLYASPLICSLIGFAVFLGCAWEWTRLIPYAAPFQILFFLLNVIGSLCLSLLIFLPYQIIGGLVWVVLSLSLHDFPRSQRAWNQSSTIHLMGVVLLPFAATSLVHLFLQPNGRALILYLLLLIWATDTGAYFAGKQYGKHKLIPAVSPGKTIEGSIGGAVVALMVAQIALLYFHPHAIMRWEIQAIFTIGMAMLGDLYMSMFKRRVNCKDTGHLLPGHGGILDRLDSLLTAAPIFYLLVAR